jgi:multimeric flavodoxin WrbA
LGWDILCGQFREASLSKKIVILKGSPRERGNSSVLADQVQRGAVAEGAEVSSFRLSAMGIHPCGACDACRLLEDCAIADGMQEIYPKILEADAIVLASPVYWFTFSAQLKTCIDRWYAIWNQHPNAFQGKKFGVVLTFSDSDIYTSGGINAIHTIETMCRFLKAEIAGMVYGSALNVGDAEKDPELMDAAEKLGRLLAQ